MTSSPEKKPSFMRAKNQATRPYRPLCAGDNLQDQNLGKFSGIFREYAGAQLTHMANAFCLSLIHI